MDARDTFLKNLGELSEELFFNSEKEIDTDKKRVAAQGMIWAACESWEKASPKCQSPIEELLLAELLFSIDGYSLVEWDGVPEDRATKLSWKTTLTVQAQIGPYRADFLLTCRADDHTRRLVVECDGHDYYERTKEQAQRDKARDRYMVAEGITVIRFTGSEIRRDPRHCRDQIEVVLNDRIEAAMAAAGMIRGRMDRG
jgi:very-short-patch-repair endonuclease